MSKVAEGLYVGDLYRAHKLFDHLQGDSSEAYSDDEGYKGIIPSVKGVISVCHDTPKWCCQSETYFAKQQKYETSLFQDLLASRHFDREYIELHVDRIRHGNGGNTSDPPDEETENTYIVHAIIRADDGEQECLFRSFAFTYDFVEAVKEQEGCSTYIHCMMGMSRSCSLVCSYLMKKRGLAFTVAYKQLKEIHPIASPNLAFICQLIQYRKSGLEVKNNRRFLIECQQLLRTIDTNDLERYESLTDTKSDDVEENAIYSCVKCRQTLFYGYNILRHDNNSDGKENREPCTSLFVEPMDWMSKVDTQNGKISCKNQRCSSKLGYYCWYGRRCSCGHLQVPAFQIQLSKVDKLFTESRLGGMMPVRNERLLL